MMRAKIKSLTVSIVIAMVAVALLSGITLAHIGYDCRFYGPVTIDGQSVPDDTVVSAWLEDPHLGPWTATIYSHGGKSWYFVDVPMDNPDTPDKDGAVDGEEVYFSVNYEGRVFVAPSGTWQRVGFVYHPLRLTAGACPLQGDVNMDGVVNIADVIKEERIILWLDPETPCADVNQDGSIDIADVIKIERIILGLD